MLTLLLGGARSGKSTLAERLGAASGMPVSFIATATADDDDMRARIARHVADRPANWQTIEAPLALADAISSVPADRCLIIDCLTLWTSNLLLDGWQALDIETQSRNVAAMAAARVAPTIVVSNEVGMSIHPSSTLGMVFRDLHGRSNSAWAAVADRAFLVVAGRAIFLEPTREALPELRGLET